MELVSIRKNCMGTITITAKFGKMRKALDFVTYPLQYDSKKLCLQAKGRWAEMDKEGNVLMSARHGDFANHIDLAIDKVKGKAEADKADASILDRIREAVHWTTGEEVGTNGLVYCNNSQAINF